MWLDPLKGMLLGGSTEEGAVSFTNPTADGPSFTNPTTRMTGSAIFGGDDEEEIERTRTNRPDGICVPIFPPGFNFWAQGSAQTSCSQANAECTVVYEKGLIGGGWEVVEGEECLSWLLNMVTPVAGLRQVN